MMAFSFATPNTRPSLPRKNVRQHWLAPFPNVILHFLAIRQQSSLRS
jgi:hypothetical protein